MSHFYNHPLANARLFNSDLLVKDRGLGWETGKLEREMKWQRKPHDDKGTQLLILPSFVRNRIFKQIYFSLTVKLN